MNRLGVRLAGSNKTLDGRQLQRAPDVDAGAPCVAQLIKAGVEVRDNREVSGGGSGFKQSLEADDLSVHTALGVVEQGCKAAEDAGRAGGASRVRGSGGNCGGKWCDDLDEQTVGRVSLNNTQRVPQAAENREGAFGFELNLHEDGLHVGHKVAQHLANVALASGVDLRALVEGGAGYAAALG